MKVILNYQKYLNFMFKISKELFVPCNLPALYVKPLKALCIADLHLGYEGIMAEYHGVFLPKIQFAEEMENFKILLNYFEKLPEKIIINGDIKHEFSETSYHEFREVNELLSFLEKNFNEIILVKGNHDNFIVRVTKNFEKTRLVDFYEEKEFIFFHGHKLVKSLEKLKNKKVIIAHEHPSIAFYSQAGKKEKIPCFLFGKVNNFELCVLPAFSTLAQGSEINLLPKEELLSPLLKKVDIDNLEVILVSKEIGVKKLAKLGEVKKVSF